MYMYDVSFHRSSPTTHKLIEVQRQFINTIIRLWYSEIVLTMIPRTPTPPPPILSAMSDMIGESSRERGPSGDVKIIKPF